MFKLWLSAVALTLLGFSLVVSEEVSINVIDKDGADSDTIARIATIACSTGKSSDELSRFDTIGKLRDYFDSLPSNNECKAKHFEAIKLLNSVVTSSNDNVCSDLKVSLIERFHADFISTCSRENHLRSKCNLMRAPRILRHFFVRYATLVNDVCKRNLVNNLEIDIEKKFPNDVDLHLNKTGLAKLNRVLAMVEGDFGKAFEIRDLNKIVLVWSMVDKAFLGGEKIGHEIKPEDLDETYDPVTRLKVRLQVKMGSIENIVQFKRICNSRYKPVYEQTILPVVRLSNLGYKNRAEKFEREVKRLRESEHLQRWYRITQFCDAVLPIDVYEDKSLDIKECLVIDREEAKQLDNSYLASYYERPLVYYPTTNSLLGKTMLEDVGTKDDQRILDDFKYNKSLRFRILMQSLKRIFSVAWYGRNDFIIAMSSEKKKVDPKEGTKKDEIEKIKTGEVLAELSEDNLHLAQMHEIDLKNDETDVQLNREGKSTLRLITNAIRTGFKQFRKSKLSNRILYKSLRMYLVYMVGVITIALIANLIVIPILG